MTRIVTQRDFDRFAALSRDDNPIHCDPVFARGTHFGATVAHGMFLYGMICGAITRRFAAVVVGRVVRIVLSRYATAVAAPTFPRTGQ